MRPLKITKDWHRGIYERFSFTYLDEYTRKDKTKGTFFLYIVFYKLKSNFSDNAIGKMAWNLLFKLALSYITD